MTRHLLIRTALATLLALPLPGRTLAGEPPAAPLEAADDKAAAYRPRRLVRSELYFAAVDLAAWDEFLSRVVTPAFPDGLSWYDVHGQWRAPGGVTEKLPSRVLIIIHTRSAASDRALRRIAEAFREQFGSAVLRASSDVLASDPDWAEQRFRGRTQLQGSSP